VPRACYQFVISILHLSGSGGIKTAGIQKGNSQPLLPTWNFLHTSQNNQQYQHNTVKGGNRGKSKTQNSIIKRRRVFFV
jgi:hypothetical protein